MGLDHYGRVYDVQGRSIKMQLWDTGGMERVASITGSYYKYSEAAILVFAMDNADSFHVLSQHLLDIVTYAENAKIFLCGNKSDLKHRLAVTDADVEAFCEQCNQLVSGGVFKTSCKSGDGVEEMFKAVATHLAEANRGRMDLKAMEDEARSFRIDQAREARERERSAAEDPNCNC